MSKQIIETRVAELQAALEQSAANHNALVGSLNEAKALLAQVEKAESEAAKAPSKAKTTVKAKTAKPAKADKKKVA